MKVGDIALKYGSLVQITKIDYVTVPVYRKETRSLLGFSYTKEIKIDETKEEVSKVWWCEVGEEWKGQHKTNTLSAYFEWDEMIRLAKYIIKQVELLKQLEDESKTD